MPENPIIPPLPADLPEDWVNTQTIAANGADVGLTKQHGYNYLMQQVNAVQRGLNQIGTSFENLSPSDLGLGKTLTFTGAVNESYNGTSDVTVDISGGAGKRTCRFVIGTSAAGWTEEDCDYLCDGTADDVEINAAIQALPKYSGDAGGGEIFILEGKYNITATVSIPSNVSVLGNGNGTLLSAAAGAEFNAVYLVGDYSSISKLMIMPNKGVGIRISGISVRVENITIGGGSGGGIVSNYSFGDQYAYISGCWIYNNLGDGIRAGRNWVIESNIISNCHYGIYSIYQNIISNNILLRGKNTQIYLGSPQSCIVSNNFCSGISGIVIGTDGTNCTIIGNLLLCEANCISLSGTSDLPCRSILISGNQCYLTSSTASNSSCISMTETIKSSVIGNYCCTMVDRDGSTHWGSSQKSIYLSGAGNSKNLIAGNNMPDKNYTSEGGTGNTFVNNKYN